jgi:hypothetical protein
MIDRVYIAHSTKLKERFEYINKTINGVDFFSKKTNIVSFDENDDDRVYSKNNYRYDEKWSIGLKKSEICITEQMFHIWDLISKSDDNICLILEDDFILKENFEDRISFIENNLPKDFDCIFVSTCCNLQVPNEFDNEFYESDYSRCTSGYIVTKEFCEKILQNKEYFAVVDWHLTFVKKELNLKFYWTKNPIIEQGSETVYFSSIR